MSNPPVDVAHKPAVSTRRRLQNRKAQQKFREKQKNNAGAITEQSGIGDLFDLDLAGAIEGTDDDRPHNHQQLEMLPDPEFAGPSSIGFEQVQFPWHAPDAYPFPATPQLSHSLDMRLEDITAMLSSSAEYTHGKAFKSGSVGSEEFRPLHQPSRSGDLTSDDWLRHRRLLSSDSITPPNGETPSSAVSLQYNPFTNAYISSEGSSATNSTTDLERLSVIQPSESSRISPRPNVPLLHVAIQTRKKSMVRLLLRRGACHVNERDPDGRTALHVAVQSGNQEIVEVLVKHGADPKAADRNGLDALRYAVEQGQEEIVEIMLDSIARGDQLSSVVEDYE